MLSYTIIHGYLGRDPELKQYTNAKGEVGHLVNFSVGVSRDVGDGTDWYNCTAFGRRAEVIDKFFSRGSQIVVWGRMQSDKYKDREGIDRIGWKLMLAGFDFCDKADSPRGQNDSAAQPQPQGQGFQDVPDSWEQAEDDIPF